MDPIPVVSGLDASFFTPRSCVSRHLWNQNAWETFSAPFAFSHLVEKICQKVRKYQRMPRKISSCTIHVNLRAIIWGNFPPWPPDSQTRGQRWLYICNQFYTSLLAQWTIRIIFFGGTQDSDIMSSVSLTAHIKIIFWLWGNIIFP